MVKVNHLKELIENNVRIQLIGHLERAPKETQDIINAAIEKTKDNTGLSLVFAFIYGGRDEIVQATKAIAQEYKDGLMSMDDIDENLFENLIFFMSMAESYGSLIYSFPIEKDCFLFLKTISCSEGSLPFDMSERFLNIF